MTDANTKDEKWFWDIIDRSRGAKRKIIHAKQIRNLTQILSQLTADEIIEFDNKFHRLLQRSCTWNLWGAAFIINGGCSDDTFYYFRSWLIGQGESVFYNAIDNPETLKDILRPRGEYEWEGLAYAASLAYEKVTGKEMERGDVVEGINNDDTPIEKKWEESELPQLFPELWKSFSWRADYKARKIQSKKIDPTLIGGKFSASEIPHPAFWLNELSKRGYDVVIRMIGESEHDLQKLDQKDYSGYLIQLRVMLEKEPTGILIKEMKFTQGMFYIEFQLYDEKLQKAFTDLGLILVEQDNATIKTGTMEFSSSEWRTYMETGVLIKSAAKFARQINFS